MPFFTRVHNGKYRIRRQLLRKKSTSVYFTACLASDQINERKVLTLMYSHNFYHRSISPTVVFLIWIIRLIQTDLSQTFSIFTLFNWSVHAHPHKPIRTYNIFMLFSLYSWNIVIYWLFKEHYVFLLSIIFIEYRG